MNNKERKLIQHQNKNKCHQYQCKHKNNKIDCEYKIALIGNPNSGKTTLFNNLTKLHQTVGNWTGVTIEKKEGNYHKLKSIKIVDLPGIYSLTPYTLEEKIARDYIIKERPDTIINIVDATNLERNLYLTTQLLEFGTNVVVALNMLDELEDSGIKIDEEKLSSALGVPVISISALKNKNIDNLMKETIKEAKKDRRTNFKFIKFDKDIENSLTKIKNELHCERFFSIKLFERDEIIWNQFIHKGQNLIIENFIKETEEKEKTNSIELISNSRYSYIQDIVANIQTKKINKRAIVTEKIDKIITNKYFAFPIFILIIWLMYFLSIQLLGNMAKLGLENLLGKLSNATLEWLTNMEAEPWLIGLIIDGILTGVGTIITFLPQIAFLFLFISLLEGCGYMARVAYIMDKLFRKIGLSGKSFIPMIVGCGCSVPAIMSARTIENNDERRLTIMLTPFIPCSAKLPVFALFAGSFFPNNPFVAPSMYFIGIIMVIIGGLVLKKLKIFKTQSEAFILELPQYRWPTARNVLLEIWEKIKSFLIKAGTIIFVASIILWVLQTFNWKFQMVSAEYSLLATIGRIIAPIFIPLGFGNWKASVALLSGIAAKEIVVSSLSILLNASGVGLTAVLNTIFTPVSAYSFMIFVLLSFPCIGALGATKNEMGSTKWLLITMAFQFITAYIIALIFYNFGLLYVYNKLIAISVAIILVLFAFVYNIIKKKREKKKNAE